MKIKTSASLLASLLLASLFFGCAKDQDLEKTVKTNTQSISRQQALEKTLDEYSNRSFQSDITVYDKDQIHSVTYRVLSNNRDVQQSMIQQLENSRITFETDQTKNSVLLKAESTSATEKESMDNNPKEDLQNGVVLIEIQSNIGEHTNMKVEIKPDSRAFVETYSSVTILQYCLGWQIWHGFWTNYPGLFVHYYNNQGNMVINDIQSTASYGPIHTFIAPKGFQKILAIPSGTPPAGEPFTFSWSVFQCIYC